MREESERCAGLVKANAGLARRAADAVSAAVAAALPLAFIGACVQEGALSDARAAVSQLEEEVQQLRDAR